MSSASSGRYQSRIFNFVYKQSRRFTKQCDRAFRRLQNTTNWVAAVGMYPFLLLFQSTRSTAKQLHSPAQQGFPLLSSTDTQPQIPPTVDTPLQQVLRSVDALSSEKAILTAPPSKPEPLKNFLVSLVSWRFKLGVRSQNRTEGSEGEKQERHSPLTTHYSPLTTLNRPPIQGIATQLSSRTLVLVSATNEILDILTFQQQEQLQDEIIAAVADYWRYQRKLGQRSRTLSGGAEGHKGRGEIQNLKSKIHNPLTPSPVLSFLDRTVAEVESNHLVPVSEVAIALFSKLNQIGASLSKSTSPKIAADDRSATQTIRIQRLIKAAIDYFFGSQGRTLEQNQPQSNSISGKFSDNLPETLIQGSPPKAIASTPQSKRLTGLFRIPKLSSTQLSNQEQTGGPLPNLEDPWLCESDLFGDFVVAEIVTESQSSHSSSKTIMLGNKKTNRALPFNRLSAYSLDKIVNSFRQFFQAPKPASEIVKQQKINNGEVVETSPKSNPLFRSPQPDMAVEISTSFSSQSTGIEANPDWIETNATVMGYVKHPLEQLLAWLDSSMLWLEEMVLKIWQWLQQRVRRQGENNQL